MPSPARVAIALIVALVTLGSAPHGAMPSKPAVARAIARDLSYHEPWTAITLRDAAYTPFVARLVRDGLFRVVARYGTYHAALVPTERGRVVLAREGWVLDDDAMIQTGFVAPVMGSTHVTISGKIATIVYRWRFEEDATFARLQASVPLALWPRSLGAACSFAAPATSFERRITLWRGPGGTWSFYPSSRRPLDGCLAPRTHCRRVAVPRRQDASGASLAIDRYLAAQSTTAFAYLEGQRQSRFTDQLVHDGIVRPRFQYATACWGERTAFAMTQTGNAVAAQRGWLVTGWGLEVSLGRYEVVPGSRRIDRTPGADPAVRFEYRFVPNANARRFPWLAPVGAKHTHVLVFSGGDAVTVHNTTSWTC